MRDAPPSSFSSRPDGSARGRRCCPRCSAAPPLGVASLRVNSLRANSVLFSLLALLWVGAGCAPNRAPARVLDLSGVERTTAADELIYPLLVHDPVIMLALLEMALNNGGDDDEETARAVEMVSPEIALAHGQLRSLPPELVTLLASELIRARTSEPDWNEVHFGWGFFFGMIGLSPETTFDLLNWWEEFEHTTWIGKTFDLSMEEGVFGYLWDLEHGMAGYAAGAAFARGR